MNALPSYPPGTTAFTVVRRLGPGVRLRLFYRDYKDAETDLSEDQARSVFKSITAAPHHAAQMARIEGFMRQMGGGEP